jgi:hypothetical protein
VVDGASHWHGHVLEVDWESVVRAFVSYGVEEAEVYSIRLP